MSSLLKYIFCDILPEDILSLYTSMPNNEGIAATKKGYDSYIHKTLHIPWVYIHTPVYI